LFSSARRNWCVVLRGVSEAQQKRANRNGLVEPFGRGRCVFVVCTALAFGIRKIVIVDETGRVVQTSFPSEGRRLLAEEDARCSERHEGVRERGQRGQRGRDREEKKKQEESEGGGTGVTVSACQMSLAQKKRMQLPVVSSAVSC